MPETELIQMGQSMALSIATQKAKQYNLDADVLYSFLLEKFCDKLLPKLEGAKNQAKYKPKAFIIKSFNGYILNFIRDYSKPVKISRKYKDLYMQERAMLRRLPDATDAQIAMECGTDLDTLHTMRKYMNTKFISFDAMLNEPAIQANELEHELIDADKQHVYDAICNISDADFNKAYKFFVLGDAKYANEPINNKLLQLKNQKHN